MANKNRFFSSLKSALLSGGLVLSPLGITFWVFIKLVGVADGLVELLPSVVQPETYLGFPVPGVGFALALIVLAMVGYTMRYYTGRRIVEFYESLLARVPILSAVYHGLKQLIESLFSSKGTHFRQPIIIEYPRRGVYCIAFLTNEESFIELDGEGSSETGLVSVFLPTTPNPTSGFYLLVPRAEVWALDMGVEQAFKLIMSAGIVTPDMVQTARPLDRPIRELVQPEV